MSDTRTNAGVDNFSMTRKMFTWSVPEERLITVMTAGNLATTQSLISLLEERSKIVSERDPSILRAPTMFQVAQLVGQTLKEVITDISTGVQAADSNFHASVIVGGQIKDGVQTIFLIYPEGNFIEITDESPFFQIGETKYGKPILVRAYDADMSLRDAVKLTLVSFDSTLKANLSVGLPIDVQTYENNTFEVAAQLRIEGEDPMYQSISNNWGAALRAAFNSLPSYDI